MMEKKFPISGKKCVSKPRQSRKRPGCIRLFVCPTTGGRLEISVSPRESILGLKTALARKLRTNPARITLIYKEKALTSGRLIDYQIPENSLLTLLPNMESGLSLHQSEKSITQALENLSETQVNDFLSGRAPLMLAIRMGENMVFVQLQLSTVQGQGQGQGSPQQKPSVTPMSQRTATLLSQRGLSASTLAQATKCLSRRIHHLQGMGKSCSPANAMAMNPCEIPRTLPVTPSSSCPLSSSKSTQPPPPPSATMTNPSPVMMAASSAPVLSSTPKPQSPMTRATTATETKLSGPSLLQLPTSSPLPQNLPSSSTTSLPSPPPSPGAVMNSLKHVGSGIYSGTFSGTLDSSLQQPNGQPRRSVHTILHILNDLLVASPVSPQPQPTSPSSPHKSQQQQQPQVFFNQNSMLTPPPSPKNIENSGSFVMEKADNELLRGKMQRVQMMLAQRKEQRGKRRKIIAPYPHQVNTLTSSDCFTGCSSLSSKSASGLDSHLGTAPPPSEMSSINTPSSPSSSSAAERPRICTHVEEGGECCSSYGKKGIEHDSLVV